MVERDPADDKDVIVELRAGTGGDEAALFAGDLHQMLTRYAEQHGFKTETLTSSGGDAGGFKELVFEISGDGAYSLFKHESGVHRVQRVPATESQGRIHTSTATVAVLPEAEELDVAHRPERPADRRLPVGRPRRPVGQHDRLRRADHPHPDRHRRHVPGRALAAPEQGPGDEDPARPPLRGRARAGGGGGREARSSQIGGGERSEKIRTYNFPQNRVTDHRVGLTVHNLDAVLAGDLDQFSEALAAEEKRQKLAAAAGG